MGCLPSRASAKWEEKSREMVAGMFRFRSHQCSCSRSYTLPAGFIQKQTIPFIVLKRYKKEEDRKNKQHLKKDVPAAICFLNQPERPKFEGVFNKRLMGFEDGFCTYFLIFSKNTQALT